MFKFNVNITYEDYYEFNVFHNSETAYGKRSIKNLRVISAVFFLIALIYFLIKYGISPVVFIGMIPLIIIFGLFVIFMKPFHRWLAGFAVDSMKNKQKLLYSPVATMEFAEEYVLEITPASELKYKYQALETTYLVRDEVIYIYMDFQRAFIVPRSSFETQEQWDSFVEFIKGKIEDVIIVE